MRPSLSRTTSWEAAVLTVSDRCARGERADLSGPAVARALSKAGFRVAALSVLPDEEARIAAALRALCRRVALVVTTGGTGIAPRDVTPQATRRVLDLELPGLGEAMRARTARSTPSAILSRAIAGRCGNSLVLNLPGSPRGAVDCLAAVLPVLPHALTLLRRPACEAHA